MILTEDSNLDKLAILMIIACTKKTISMMESKVKLVAP